MKQFRLGASAAICTNRSMAFCLNKPSSKIGPSWIEVHWTWTLEVDRGSFDIKTNPCTWHSCAIKSQELAVFHEELIVEYCDPVPELLQLMIRNKIHPQEQESLTFASWLL